MQHQGGVQVPAPELGRREGGQQVHVQVPDGERGLRQCRGKLERVLILIITYLNCPLKV